MKSNKPEPAVPAPSPYCNATCPKCGGGCGITKIPFKHTHSCGVCKWNFEGVVPAPSMSTTPQNEVCGIAWSNPETLNEWKCQLPKGHPIPCSPAWPPTVLSRKDARGVEPAAALEATRVIGNSDAERIAAQFHEAYERLAPQFGYETRRESAKRWADVPAKNRRLMIAVCQELFGASLSGSARPTQFKADTLFGIYCNGRADIGAKELGGINWDGWQRVANYVNAELSEGDAGMQPWISVNERLPELDKSVLCYGQGVYWVALRRGHFTETAGFWEHNGDLLPFEMFTDWQELKPPVSGDKEKP